MGIKSYLSDCRAVVKTHNLLHYKYFPSKPIIARNFI